LDPQSVTNQFLESAEAWLCDAYSLDIRYLASKDQVGIHLLDALLIATPFPPVKEDHELELDIGTTLAGRQVLTNVSRKKLLEIFSIATSGQISVNGLTLKLDSNRALDFYSEPHTRETWLANLHLQVLGPSHLQQSAFQASNTNRLLRTAAHPFDGIDDLCSWLNLSDPRQSGKACGINLRVLPAIDVFIDTDNLEGNIFSLRLESHFKVATKNVGLAIREFPGNGIATRQQIAPSIKWEKSKNKRRIGTVKTSLQNADSVLTMLSVNGLTVRRHWFVDQSKAVNPRYVAMQLFDRELRYLRQCVLLDSSEVSKNDSARFEKGISSLFFLLGFAPGDQLETDAPDLIMMSPNGRVVLVECTVKISDFRNKLEKIASRRRELTQKLESTGHNLGVDALLVCGSQRAQISVDQKHLNDSEVTLFTREDIEQAFFRIRNPVSPDDLLKEANKSLVQARNVFD
jgi:hypothetical protein